MEYPKYRVTANHTGWYVEGKYSEDGEWKKINTEPYEDGNKAMRHGEDIQRNKMMRKDI